MMALCAFGLRLFVQFAMFVLNMVQSIQGITRREVSAKM